MPIFLEREELGTGRLRLLYLKGMALVFKLVVPNSNLGKGMAYTPQLSHFTCRGEPYYVKCYPSIAKAECK